MKKKTLFAVLSSFFAVALIVTFTSSLGKNLSKTYADGGIEYSITLDASNAVDDVLPSGLAEQSINTKLGNPIDFTYTGASVVSGKHVGLETGGTICNIDLIKGIRSITANFTGEMKIFVSGDIEVYEEYGELISGAKLEFTKTYDSVRLEALTNVEVQSLSMDFSCSSRFTGVEGNRWIAGFDSCVNIGDGGSSVGRRGWGSDFWAAMNFERGDGGRFHFFSEVGGLHNIVWNYNTGAGAVIKTYLNNEFVEDLTLPATGRWYSDGVTGEDLVVQYNLKQGWNELTYATPFIDNNYLQIGSINVLGNTDRRFDPNDIDTSIKTLHIEAEHGNYKSTNGQSQSKDFYGDSYSQNRLLGGIEATGTGSEMTFNLPAQGAGKYRMTAKVGCGKDQNIKVLVDDMVTEWADDCITKEYTMKTGGASPAWNVTRETDSLDITLASGWNRIRVLFNGDWFTLDCIDLVKLPD